MTDSIDPSLTPLPPLPPSEPEGETPSNPPVVVTVSPPTLPLTPLLMLSILLTLVGMRYYLFLVGMTGALATFVLALRLLWPEVRFWAQELLVDR